MVLPFQKVITRMCSLSCRDYVPPKLNYKYLCDPQNLREIQENIKRRKGVGNIELVQNLYKSLGTSSDVENELLKQALLIPNDSHPALKGMGEDPRTVRRFGPEPKFDFDPKTFEFIAKRSRLTRTDHISRYTGPRSYFLIDQLSDLESALVRYSVDRLVEEKFKILSVPDLIPRDVIEYCGMNTRGKRTQVYTLDEKTMGPDLCLSGTAEIGISYYLRNRHFEREQLPLKIGAVSRCFRAETSRVSEEKGIYRVHQFTKVEMYGVATPDQSDDLLEEFRQIQESHFANLNLQLKTLDMPEHELGAQAYRKYDIEAYFPGKRIWGELSSASNCTDFQSRRLNMTYNDGFVHTVNGTACAVPRLIIALVETHQKKNETVAVPDILVPYLGHKTIARSRVPKTTAYR